MPHPVWRLLTRSDGKEYSPARGGSGRVRRLVWRLRCGRCGIREQLGSAGAEVPIGVPRIVLNDVNARAQ